MIGVESKDMHMPNLTISSIRVPNNRHNDATHSLLDYSRYTLVESIEIGDDCFESVKTFKIDGLNRLRSLRIGKNSFTNKKNDFGYDSSKSFHILNCESLESIHHSTY